MADEAPPPRPAGFWIRAVAFAVDVVVFVLVQISLSAMATAILGPPVDGVDSLHGSVFLFTWLFTAAYTTVLHTVAGQTIGKSLVGVRVVGVDGAPLTAGPAFLRYLSYYLSLIPFGLGFLMAGLRRDKRALHDLIAASRVERLPGRRRVVRRVSAPRPVPVASSPESAARPGPGA